MKRTYEVTIKYQLNAEDSLDGKKQVETIMNMIGLQNFEVKELKQTRTRAQNRAMHLYFTQLADALNDIGFDMRKTIRQDLAISWTGYGIKEYLWKPVQKALYGKKSTTQLTTDQLDKVFDIINREISERTQGEVFVPFPSIETLMIYIKENEEKNTSVVQKESNRVSEETS